MLEHVLMFLGHLVITGDFNFHIDVASDLFRPHLTDSANSLGLTQLVQSPTHKLGHTLDLLITKSESKTATSTTISGPCLSDHLAGNFTLPKQPHLTKSITYHKLEAIVIAEFVADE